MECPAAVVLLPRVFENALADIDRIIDSCLKRFGAPKMQQWSR